MALSTADKERLHVWFLERNLEIAARMMTRFEIYHDLILHWSTRQNLISTGDLPRIVERHILDSLTPYSTIPTGGRLVDIGSGAGVPAIPIAILRPNLKLTLIEARHKKVLFLKEAALRLELENVKIVEIRFEDFPLEVSYDVATMRALPGWERLIGGIKGLLKPEGVLIYYERPGRCRLINRIDL